MGLCHNCGTEIAGIWCPSCGALASRSEDEISCENHPGERAVACCVVCGKPVCGDCTTTANDSLQCDVPEHHKHAADWALVTLVADSFEAAMLKANLVQAGIPTRVADPRSFAGTLAFRPHLHVRILVGRSDLESARALLRSFQLLSNES